MSAVCVVLTSSPALAGNGDEVPVGAVAAITGAALTATTDDGAAAFYNPAGLAAVDRQQIDATLSVYGVRFERIRPLLQATTGERVDATSFDWVLLPSGVSYALPLFERVTLGIGVFVPEQSDSLLRAQLTTNDETWQITYRTTSASYFLPVAVGARVASWLRVGVSAIGHYSRESYSLQFAGAESLEAGATRAAGIHLSELVDNTGYGLTFGAGLQADLTPELALGFAARAPTLNLASSRTAVSVTSLQSKTEGATSISEQSTFAADVSSILPGELRLGLAWRRGGSFLALDGSLLLPLNDATGADSLDRGPEFNLRLGGVWRINAPFEVGAGIFTDRSPLRTRPIHFYGLSVGGRLHRDYLLANRRPLSFVTTLALRYAFGQGDAQALSVGDLNGVSAAVGARTETHELSLNIGSALRF